MKTKDLINILNQYDPNGEKQILISNSDIDYIIKEPMYNDGKGYIITKRNDSKQDQPLEITLKLSDEKINLVPLDTFEYYRKKIIEDQEFIEIKTENNVFYWESTKLIFNKLVSLVYCKEYMTNADKNLYPYKDSLSDKIKLQITNLIINYKKDYLKYCNNINCSNNLKTRLLILMDKIFQIKSHVIFGLPMVNNNSITIKTIGFNNFNFEIFDYAIKYTHKDIYTPQNINTTNISTETFDFEKTIGSNWMSLLDNKIEKMLFY